jgi:SAM-dependent methyltransferase
MEIHREELSDVTRYIENHRHQTLDDNREEYNATMKILRRYIQPGAETPMLEIGTGTGAFPLMCRLDGIPCDGVEISPQLVEYAVEFAKQYNLESTIRLGNIEDQEIGEARYQIIVCNSVFEHIEHWRPALKKIFKALKPGGVFLFSSTNKFSFTSGEYKFPLYGWLPDQWRYALRRKMQGPDIMKLGIDFNQFRYPVLRKAFQETGYNEIYDLVDLADPVSAVKKRILNLARVSPVFKWPVLTFNSATVMVGIKKA